MLQNTPALQAFIFTIQSLIKYSVSWVPSSFFLVESVYFLNCFLPSYIRSLAYRYFYWCSLFFEGKSTDAKISHDYVQLYRFLTEFYDDFTEMRIYLIVKQWIYNNSYWFLLTKVLIACKEACRIAVQEGSGNLLGIRWGLKAQCKLMRHVVNYLLKQMLNVKVYQLHGKLHFWLAQ